MKKSIEAFNRSPWYLQVILGLVGLAVAVALAIPLSWLVEILWGYVLQLITIIFKWISSWMPAGKLFSWKAVFDAVPKIVERLPLTLGLTIAGAFFGLILALVFAVVKINRVRILYPIQAVFVSFLRGTPILVQLMLTYYGIPLFLRYLNGEFGLDWNINEIPPAIFAITAFAFNEAAYMSETIRAAIQAVDAGEIEAARSLGMTSAQVYRRVIIPNAAVIATPSLINSLIGLTKGTSLAFSAGIVEMYAQAQILGGADYRYFERYISVALVYWVISILIEYVGRSVENHMAIKAPEVTDISGIGGDR